MPPVVFFFFLFFHSLFFFLLEARRLKSWILCLTLSSFSSVLLFFFFFLLLFFFSFSFSFSFSPYISTYAIVVYLVYTDMIYRVILLLLIEKCTLHIYIHPRYTRVAEVFFLSREQLTHSNDVKVICWVSSPYFFLLLWERRLVFSSSLV